jgi:hypothetical protein
LGNQRPPFFWLCRAASIVAGMATPDYSAEIAALRQQIAAGVVVVSTDGTTTTHGGTDDLRQRIAYLEELQRQAAGTPRRRPMFNRMRLG